MKISGPLNLAGLEYVANLTALNALTELFEGRIVNMNGTVYIYSGSTWTALAAGANSVPNVTAPTADQVLRSNGTIAAWDDQYPDDSGASGKFLQSDGAGNVSWQDPPSTLPSQSGNSGKYLTTNGTAVSWSAILRAGVAAGSANHVLINDGSGNWSSEAALAITRGGFGQDTTLFSGYVKKASGGAFSAGAIAEADLPTGINANKIGGGNVSSTEFDLLDGLTGSPVQTQLDAKLPLTGGTLSGALLLPAANPTGATEAAHKGYVDSVAAGLSPKTSVYVATTGNITLSGTQTIDGVAVAVNDRVLVKDQTTTSQNGIWKVQAGAWQRTTDADSLPELASASVFVEEGTLNHDSGWVCTSGKTGTIDVTAVTWTQFSGAGAVTTDGQGIEVSGTQLSLELDGSTLSKSSTGVKVAAGGITDTEVSASANIAITKLNTFTSAQLAARLTTDKTGSGLNVFGTSPTLVTPVVDDGLLLNHETSVTTPASGKVAVYPKSDNKLYIKDSSGNEIQVGTGSSSGINYCGTPDAESGVGTWATYADAAAATPVDGTGGSPSVTWTQNTTTPLRGNADFKFSKGATNRQGDGVAIPFTISTVDKSKKLQVSFDLNTNTTNYSAGDLVAYVYDVTNSVLITPSSTSVPKLTGSFAVTFDSTTSTSYRLILHVATTNATAYDLYFDNFVLGPGQLVQGPVVGDWRLVSTPASGWFVSGPTNVTLQCWEMQIGSSAKYRYEIVSTGTSAAFSDFEIRLPDGRTLNSNVLSLAANRRTQMGGPGSFIKAGVGACTLIGWTQSSSNSFYIKTVDTAAVLASSQGTITESTPFAWTSTNTYLSFETDLLPIAELAGQGTTNLGQGAQVEYAYPTGTVDADSASDGSATAYGPAGAAWSVCTDLHNKYIRWQYPPQTDDIILCEVSADAGVSWSIDTAPWAGNATSTSTAGVKFISTTGSVTRFQVGRYAEVNPTAWNSSHRIRFRKAKASSPVGFGLAASGNSGLINYYQEDDTTLAACTFQGNLGGSASSGVAIKVTRVGRVVTVEIPSFQNVTPTTNSISLVGNTLLPTWARPSIFKTLMCPVYNNGAWTTTPGYWFVSTGGQLSCFRDITSTAWTNSVVAGWYSTQITYTV